MSNFKILSDREHALSRPSMYIGSVSAEPVKSFFNYTYSEKTIVPGLIKIISEIIDNSVDEAIRTNFHHGNKIDVAIGNDIDGWWVSVEDNGRGIPSTIYDGKYQAELCWTVAKSGTNFSDENRITAGMNGVGSFLTAVYSNSFSGRSDDGKKHVSVECSNNLESVKTVSGKSTKKTGTSVRFYPDLERFDGMTQITQDHLDVIRDRLVNLSICYPKITFSFNGDKIQCPSRAQLGKKFHEDAIAVETNDALFVIAPSGEDQEFRHLSFVNGLNIKNGGSQVDFIMDSIVSELQPIIKKKWKIDVLPANIKQHLFLGSWIRSFPNPKFDSQTKERLTNSKAEIRNVLSFDSAKIAKDILNRPSIIDPMVQAILYKKELADRLAAARAMKSAKKKKIANHIQANHSDPEKRNLLICEGLSASGMILEVRDPDTIGAYSLKGKVLNTRGMKPVDIIKNKELSELMAIVGIDFGSKAENLNYGAVWVFTDADPDGSAIFCLLLNFFSNWPELFHEKRIYRLESPLYIATKGSTRKLFYTAEEYASANLGAGWTIDYCKGLGSLEKEVYEDCIANPKLRLITFDDVEDANKIEMAFGDSADARKEWMMNDD